MSAFVLMVRRNKKQNIPQQLLGVQYSWGDMLDAVADIYTGVSSLIPTSDLRADKAGDSSCSGPF